MKLLTGLFRMARKRTQTTDNDLGMFRKNLEDLVANKDSLSDEEVVEKVEELKAMGSDLPDGDEKAELERFLEDFKSVKEQDEASAKEAANMVADFFEKLDTEAMKDAPAVEETTEEVVEETPAEEVPAEETVETEEVEESEDGDITEALETKTEEKEEVKDDDPLSEYTLEEIYQYVKKRTQEDMNAEDSAEVVEDEEKEDEEEEVVTDHAPQIPVTINNGTPAKGSLAEMFAEIKEGGR